MFERPPVAGPYKGGKPDRQGTWWSFGGALTLQLSPGGRIGEIPGDLPTAVCLTVEYIDRGLLNLLRRASRLVDFERPYQPDDRGIAVDHCLVDFYRIAVRRIRIS